MNVCRQNNGLNKRERTKTTTTTTAHLPDPEYINQPINFYCHNVYTNTNIYRYTDSHFTITCLFVCSFVRLFVIAHQMCARTSVNIENGPKRFQITGHRKWVWFWNIIRFEIGLDKWPTDHRIRRWQNLNIQFYSNVSLYLFTLIFHKHLFAFFRKSSFVANAFG